MWWTILWMVSRYHRWYPWIMVLPEIAMTLTTAKQLSHSVWKSTKMSHLQVQNLLVKSPKLLKNTVAVYLETFSIFTHGFQIVYLLLLWLSGDAIIEKNTNATSHIIVLTFLQVCLMCWQLSITFGSRRMAVSFGGLCTKASKVFERMVVVVNGWVITTLDTGQDTTGYMAL